jgi:autotransporter-associated beta strand protein
MSVQSNSIGSLEGDGLVYLGATALEIGGNGVDTTFSGTISDEGGISDGTGGSIVKIGTETLVLAGASTYTGGTTIEAGSLLVNNATGSATGTGAVQVNGGTVGGSGTVSGPITVGTNSGSGAVLDPGASAGATGLLTTLGSALFQSDATCHIDISSADGEADGLVADGVTISGAAQIVFTDLGSQTLPAGTVFTVIANTAATPIAGIFANLPDGSVVMVGSNAFVVDYEGGDGNDLTLTAE